MTFVPQELIKETQSQQVAGLVLINVPEYKIAEQLGLSRYAVKKILKSQDFKEVMQELGQRSTEIALNCFKAKMEELEPLAFAALKQNLLEGKLEAVKVWGDFVGVKDKQDGGAGNGGVTVVMPNFGQAKPDDAIEVKSE